MRIHIRENKVPQLPNGASIPTTSVKTLSRDHFGEVPAVGDYIRRLGVRYEVIAREWTPGISGEIELTVRAVSDITRVKGPSEPDPVEAWSPHSIESRVALLAHEMSGPGGVVYHLRKRLTELDGRITTQQVEWGGSPPEACVLDRLDALEKAAYDEPC